MMMIDELNYRVKNTLSTVQSIVWQALRKDSDPTTIREAMKFRLFALSRSHDLLSSGELERRKVTGSSQSGLGTVWGCERRSIGTLCDHG